MKVKVKMWASIFFLFVFFIFLNNEALSTSNADLEPKELKYFSIVKAAAKKYNVDISLLMAIIKVESDFNHRAVSPRGAIGLMQLMPKTAKYIGMGNPREPRKNIYAGAKYFAKQIEAFGRIDLALAAYNAGPTLVRKLRRVPRFKETILYIAKVLKYEKKYAMLKPSARVRD